MCATAYTPTMKACAYYHWTIYLTSAQLCHGHGRSILTLMLVCKTEKKLLCNLVLIHYWCGRIKKYQLKAARI